MQHPAIDSNFGNFKNLVSIRFIHISDSHLELPTRDADKSPLLSENCSDSVSSNIINPGFALVTEKIKSLVNEGLVLDFIIHTGDVCNSDDSPGATQITAQLASDLLGQCGVDYIWMNGNHDRLDHIVPYRCSSQNLVINSISEKASGSFSCTYQGTTLLFLDARPRYTLPPSMDSAGNESQTSSELTQQPEIHEWDGRHPHDPEGYLDPEELDVVRKLIADAPEQVVVFTHYPPVKLDCPWVDKNMCISNGSLLHEILKQYQDKVNGVFFGHVHHSQQRLYDGVLYVATGAVAHEFDTSSHLTEARVSGNNVHHLNYVHINVGNIFIKQYSLSVI